MTISDDDIINNLNSLQDKVNGIITKTTKSMKPELVELNDGSENKNIFTLPTLVNINTLIFIATPVVTLLILYFTQPFFIMEEVKVENTFFTKKEMSVLLLLAYTFGLSIIFYLIIFICIYDLKNK
jgi:flagellar biosynthesis protein FlhB